MTDAGAVIRLEELAGAIGAARSWSGPLEERLALALYRALAQGEPVSAATLAERLDLEEGAVEQVLDRWSLIFRDEQRRVVGFTGLSLGETPHRLQLNGHTLYGWCAWDTLFLPQLLDVTAQIQSRCPASGEPVRLTVAPTRVETVVPTGAVVSMLTPGSAFDRDVISSFCHYIHFFSSAESAAAWRAQHQGIFVLSVAEAFELGQLANRMNFPTALD
jgi:alkylmercury lyase